MAYIQICIELDKDKYWEDVDKSGYITHIVARDLKKNISSFESIQRIKRCRIRRQNRSKTITTKYKNNCIHRYNPVDYSVKPILDSYDDFINLMAYISKHIVHSDIEDFQDNICCPILFENRYQLYNKLMQLFKNGLQSSCEKILNSNLITEHMFILGTKLSETNGYINLEDLKWIIGNIHRLYDMNICPICICMILATLLYETFIFASLKSFSTDVFIQRYNISINETPFIKYWYTKDTKYWHLVLLLMSTNVSWFKDLNSKLWRKQYKFTETKFKKISIPKEENFSPASINKSFQLLIYKKTIPVDVNDTTINVPIINNDNTFESELERSYIELGSFLPINMYINIITHIIKYINSRELDIEKFHDVIYGNDIMGIERELSYVIHTAALKYRFNKHTELTAINGIPKKWNTSYLSNDIIPKSVCRSCIRINLN